MKLEVMVTNAAMNDAFNDVGVENLEMSTSDEISDESPSNVNVLPPSAQKMLAKPIYTNKFIKRGPKSPLSVLEPVGQDYVRVRIDMPGVNPETLELKIRDNRISFRARENRDPKRGLLIEQARTYSGSVVFDDPSLFTVETYDYLIGNGMLLLFVERNDKKATALNHVLIEKEGFTLELKPAYSPLMSLGMDRYYKYAFTEDAFILGVDMPGVGKNSITRVFAEGQKIRFRAEEKKQGLELSENEERRIYEGCFEVKVERFKAVQVKYEIARGVLWMEVPRLDPVRRPVGSVEPEGSVLLNIGRFGLEMGPFSTIIAVGQRA